MKNIVIVFVVLGLLSCNRKSDGSGKEEYPIVEDTPFIEKDELIKLIVEKKKAEIGSREGCYFVTHLVLKKDYRDSVSNLNFNNNSVLNKTELNVNNIVQSDTTEYSEDKCKIEIYVSDLIDNRSVGGLVSFAGILYFNEDMNKLIGGSTSIIAIRSDSDTISLDEIRIIDY